MKFPDGCLEGQTGDRYKICISHAFRYSWMVGIV